MKLLSSRAKGRLFLTGMSLCLCTGPLSAQHQRSSQAENLGRSSLEHKGGDQKTQRAIEESIRRGVDFLVEAQNANGSWGGPTKTKGLNIYAPIPGAHHAFRMGSSTLALHGLIESGDQREEVLEAIIRGESWLLEALPKLRRADQTTIYNCWGHAYALRALASLARRDGLSAQKREIYHELARQQIERLVLYQDVDGGWGYYSDEFHSRRPSGGSMTFTTATVLLAIADIKSVFPLEFPKVREKQALASIWRNRVADGSYIYSTGHWSRPRYSINRPGGSLARSQVCHAALREYGDKTITDAVIERWLTRLIERNGWLDLARKRPVPHETHFAVSGYFYYYGHYYATELMQMLPETQWQTWQEQIASIIVPKQEADGSWWDYPLYDYHQAYGTGYSLVVLSRCRDKTQSK